MTRSIKDLREFINVSRLSIRPSDEESDNDSLNEEVDDAKLGGKGPIGFKDQGNRDELRTKLLDNNKHVDKSEQKAYHTERGQRHSIDGGGTGVPNLGPSSLDDIVIGRPGSAIGARRPPTAKGSSRREKPRFKPQETTEDLSTPIADIGTGLEIELCQGGTNPDIVNDTLATYATANPAGANVNQSSNEFEEIFKYVDVVVISAWLEISNECLDSITSWLKKDHNFLRLSHFLLSDFQFTKRKQLFEMEVSVILDELQFAFRVGISSKKVTLQDLTNLLSMVVREYPAKIYSKDGVPCILNMLCIFCCGKNQSYKNLLSNIKYSTRNAQVAQWMLAIRAFSLLSICNGILDFYRNVSELTVFPNTAAEFSQGGSTGDIIHNWLFAAIELDYLDVLIHLLKYLNCNCSGIVDGQGRNLVFKAVMYGRQNILEFLIEKVKSTMN